VHGADADGDGQPGGDGGRRSEAVSGEHEHDGDDADGGRDVACPQDVQRDDVEASAEVVDGVQRQPDGVEHGRDPKQSFVAHWPLLPLDRSLYSRR